MVLVVEWHRKELEWVNGSTCRSGTGGEGGDGAPGEVVVRDGERAAK